MNNLEILKKINIFSRLNGEELNKILVLSEEKQFKKGEVVFNEGDSDLALYIVLEGRVKIMKEITPENSKTLASLDPYSVFGELSLFDKGTRSATAVVSEDSRLMAIAYDRFEELLDGNDSMAAKILREVVKETARRLRETNEKLQDNISWGLIAKL